MRGYLKGPVVIVGGGVIGVATLYELASRNVDTVLLEAESEVAAETSFANGGILSPSAPDPWNSPGIARSLLASSLSRDSALRLHLRALPGLLGWGLRFVYNSNSRLHVDSTDANYALSAASTIKTMELIDRLGIDIHKNALGTLRTFSTEAALLARVSISERLKPMGLSYQRLSKDETIAREPLLRASSDRVYGALYYPNDVVGDARLFAKNLAIAACRAGATLQLQTRVTRILRKTSGGFEVHCDGSVIDASRVVIAGGSASANMARSLGVKLPIRPAKGYSLTYDAGSVVEKPTHAVVDDAMHAVVVPLGNRIRVVAFADFAGDNKQVEPARIGSLRRFLEILYPTVAAQLNQERATPWAGLRPMSADGRPFIGESIVPGLWINAGHGQLGWTMAAGSASLLADLMSGDQTTIDPRPFSASR